jgi:predicted anti-sigma-YlaC factor YlaD
MRHLTEEELVRLVFGDTRWEQQLRRGDHLRSCSQCRARYQVLSWGVGSLRQSTASPPALAWSRLKGRLERSRRPVWDWIEPRWLPLVILHLGAVLAALVLMIVLAGWLESSSVWESIARLPMVGAMGPRRLVGLVFLVGGGLFVLALTPVLCLESKWVTRPRDHGQSQP